MSTAITSPPTHIPAAQPGLKPCQRSCRGLMLYFPPSSQQDATAAKVNQSTSWRSSEPVCLGLSAARNGPNLDLQKLHEAREIPAGQRVDFSVVIGHAVYQTNSDTKVLPPGCMTGLEFLRFYKMPMDMGATTTATSSQGTLPPGGVHGLGSATSDTMVSSAIKAITDSLRGFAGSFRILTSSADTNARLSKTWSSIVNFDPHQYADKFEAQAYKNLDSMTKWMRDLQDAVFKPKA